MKRTTGLLVVIIGFEIFSLVIPTTIGVLYSKNNFDDNNSNNYLYHPFFKSINNDDVGRFDDDKIDFYSESNKSIYIIKISNPHDIRLEQLTWNITQNAIGEKWSSGAFVTRCQVYDEKMGNGLIPIMFTTGDGWTPDIKLQYYHFQLGQRINYTYDNRTLHKYDNQSIVKVFFEYPFHSSIPPGTWYLVFSSVILDLEQTDILTEQSIRMVFSGNCSDMNISTSEGGNVYAFWYGEYDATVIISKSNVLEMMINGKKCFHVENTLFYWYDSIPVSRGFWNLKWITPVETKTFRYIVLNGRSFYREDTVEGCIWGMGRSGNYTIITSYREHSRTISGYDWAYYPVFVGLDVKLP
ncbi:Uncharacterised protein [uncultured archaeon]|nr:Uncharacterised protein [uncultured archaeon]